jgi:hypothetical protein
MEVIVDGQRNLETPGKPEDVLALLGILSKRLRDQGRAILSIEADGEEISPERLVDKFTGRALDDFGELVITSEAISVMVANCLDDLDRAVPELPFACRSLAAIFQSESPEEGFEPFQELARLWSFIKTRQTLVVSSLDLDLDACELNGQSLADMHTALNAYLEEAAQATKNLDYTLLGDLLEYELAPRAEQEAGIVALLRDCAGARSA